MNRPIDPHHATASVCVKFRRRLVAMDQVECLRPKFSCALQLGSPCVRSGRHRCHYPRSRLCAQLVGEFLCTWLQSFPRMFAARGDIERLSGSLETLQQAGVQLSRSNAFNLAGSIVNGQSAEHTYSNADVSNCVAQCLFQLGWQNIEIRHNPQAPVHIQHRKLRYRKPVDMRRNAGCREQVHSGRDVQGLHLQISSCYAGLRSSYASSLSSRQDSGQHTDYESDHSGGCSCDRCPSVPVHFTRGTEPPALAQSMPHGHQGVNHSQQLLPPWIGWHSGTSDQRPQVQHG